jgi:hypothetical protein
MKRAALLVLALLAVAAPAQAAVSADAGGNHNTAGLGFPNTFANAEVNGVSVRSKPDRSEYTVQAGGSTVEVRYVGDGILNGLF